MTLKRHRTCWCVAFGVEVDVAIDVVDVAIGVTHVDVEGVSSAVVTLLMLVLLLIS